uniref:Uncharacterized protein n=1 Tax=Arundo donax TaxID=35708 RepID=A0A0A8ZFK2_ARUDO
MYSLNYASLFIMCYKQWICRELFSCGIKLTNFLNYSTRLLIIFMSNFISIMCCFLGNHAIKFCLLHRHDCFWSSCSASLCRPFVLHSHFYLQFVFRCSHSTICKLTSCFQVPCSNS